MLRRGDCGVPPWCAREKNDRVFCICGACECVRYRSSRAASVCVSSSSSSSVCARASVKTLSRARKMASSYSSSPSSSSHDNESEKMTANNNKYSSRIVSTPPTYPGGGFFLRAPDTVQPIFFLFVCIRGREKKINTRANSWFRAAGFLSRRVRSERIVRATPTNETRRTTTRVFFLFTEICRKKIDYFLFCRCRFSRAGYKHHVVATT